jgi:tetratricopeptide (TPR) repeat protein
VHLNGSLRSLSVEALETNFKLTTSSYLAPESFTSSNWNFPFQRDLEFASAIVFVGYSMYDIEIQKILHANPHYVKKTYFVTRDEINDRTRFTLEKFGTVLPIGAQAFGAALAEKAADFEQEAEQLVLASLWRYEVDESATEIRDTDVDAFLMRGDVSDSLLDAAVAGAKGAPLLVPRTDIANAVELLRAGGRLVITGEFGNGKTVFLRCLRTHLALSGASVYTADQSDPHQHDDLERLVSSGEKGYLLIDGYDQNPELLRHYIELNPANLGLILSARTSNHERRRELLASEGMRLHEFAIDELDADEVGEFIRIVDNVGYWGDKAALPAHTKREIINRDHRKQLSLTLLGLLAAPQMVSRVRDLLGGLLNDQRRRDTVFAIALLSSIDMPLNSSLIAEIALNDEIYSTGLRSDPGFKQLFPQSGSKITTKSSIFALSLISHQFSSTYIVDQLLKIVAAIGHTWGEVREKRDIQTNLLRFSVVERLLPERQRKNNLVRYYENLKREIPWLKNDPHFWLQYGMTQLTYKDYDKAQGYFDQAYALAERKHDYHTVHIDTQQARLYLLRSLEVIDSSAAYKYFADAHQLLRKTPDDVHKYRQVERYKDVYDQRFSGFSKANKAYFEQACRATLSDLVRAMKEWDGALGHSRITQRVCESLQAITDEIKSARSTNE